MTAWSDKRSSAWKPPPKLMAYMAAVGARVSPEEFIRAVSDAYHEVESHEYDSTVRPVIEGHLRPLLGAIFAPVVLSRDAAILDLGCGTGFAAEAVLDHFDGLAGSLQCADTSGAMLERCRVRLQHRQAAIPVTFTCASIEEIASAARSFDLAITSSLLHHIPDLDSFFSALRPLVRP